MTVFQKMTGPDLIHGVVVERKPVRISVASSRSPAFMAAAIPFVMKAGSVVSARAVVSASFVLFSMAS